MSQNHSKGGNTSGEVPPWHNPPFARHLCASIYTVYTANACISDVPSRCNSISTLGNFNPQPKHKGSSAQLRRTRCMGFELDRISIGKLAGQRKAKDHARGSGAQEADSIIMPSSCCQSNESRQGD
eukprot:1160941-Pelagomonas_calceolata.AAC.6